MKTVIKIILGVTLSCRVVPADLDAPLRAEIETRGLRPLFHPDTDRALVDLGEKLFFDKILSGNKDISCSGCHHPTLSASDKIPLSIGTRGDGLGPTRVVQNGAERTPRNSPEIFNRGYQNITSMFWDGRVEELPDGSIAAPEVVPANVRSALAAQAMFPVLSRGEMRGLPGDLDADGNPNELALLPDDPEVIWPALMQRVLSFDRYVDLFTAAFPTVAADELNFGHAATAIAAFEASAFTLINSPWDLYLSGDENALSDPAKRGALLFFGEAQCASCHSGSLFSDQKYHNIAAPQVSLNGSLDVGREDVTGALGDRFAFRTPPLRNVTVTGPYFHDGAYASLKDAVVHHLDPSGMLSQYDPSQLGPSLSALWVSDEQTQSELLASLDPRLLPVSLSEEELDDLLAFLTALEDPVAHLTFTAVPEFVPSGISTDY